MTGHKIDFIALDCTIKTSRLLLVNQPLPQVRGHVLHIIFIFLFGSNTPPLAALLGY